MRIRITKSLQQGFIAHLVNSSEDIRAAKDSLGNIWLVASDVCAVLGITNHNVKLAKALTLADRKFEYTKTRGGIHPLNYVNEKGLNLLIIRGTKKMARKYQDILAEGKPTLSTKLHPQQQ